MNQSAPCCVVALNMINISSQFRLTTDSLRGFLNPAGGFPGTKTYRTFPAGLFTAWWLMTKEKSKINLVLSRDQSKCKKFWVYGIGDLCNNFQYKNFNNMHHVIYKLELAYKRYLINTTANFCTCTKSTTDRYHFPCQVYGLCPIGQTT